MARDGKLADVIPITAAAGASRRALTASPRHAPVDHNLNGQRLGRKGRDTRDRIIAAAQDIIAELHNDGMITLSEVARRASIRIGTLYLYFADLTELVLAVLEPVMATVEDEYVHLVREYWPDEDLHDRAREFVGAYFGFWTRHSPLLHLRNSMADRGDERMLMHRVRSAIPVMRLMLMQMDSRPMERGTVSSSMASALMTGLERVATVMTDDKMTRLLNEPMNQVSDLLQVEARIFELAIRDQRQVNRSA
ncbi:TetR/AcrR family transcriptional regulator [Novosphingobium piscinae]|uniref:TetR/AcrR family transcriptional regulator n=1 Tax=Novosphingobium piscinae TaxID=1507448 RepID=UPI003610A484